MTYVLVGENTYEEEIKKSRFIAIASPVDTVEQAMAFIEKRSIPDARHNCWAYKIGDNYRFSDDGEPGGTAGRPILQAIEGQECDFVAVLVIRWFGGIKLGTGGLVRAYGGAAAECLRTARKKKYVPTVPIECFCPYAEIDRFKARFDDFQVRIEDEEYGAEGVLWKLQLPEEQIQQFEESLQNMSSGQGWLKS
ncbi:MAG TPA: YigZ family protein [Paenalcaligenes sp.]|nr:YigZ family protein [Paenalcaligenes sp.]